MTDNMITNKEREERTAANGEELIAGDRVPQPTPRPKASDRGSAEGIRPNPPPSLPRPWGVIESVRQTIVGGPSEGEKSLDQVVEIIRKKLLEQRNNDDVQEEYIKILGLLIHRRKGEFETSTYIKYFELAVDALSTSSPNVVFARKLVSELTNYRPKKSNLDPRAAIMGGFIATSILLGFLFHILLPEGLKEIRGLVIAQSTFYPLLLMVAMAFIGSIVSMLLRIEEFAAMRNKDSLTLLAVTFFRPWIAMSMAIFIFAVLKTEIISLGDLNFAAGEPNERAYFILAVIGFISGFSERFARGILERAEERVAPGKPPEPQSS